jgi:AhpD family alkylhydroperoxidase
MARSTRVPKAQITGIFGGLLKLMARKMLGAVPEGAEVMWHYPAVLKDMMGFGRKAERWDRLDRNLASLANMAAASLVGCSFCLDLHYFMVRNKGLDEAKAGEVPRWRDSAVFTPLERRVRRSARCCSTARLRPASTRPGNSTLRLPSWSRTAGSPASTGSSTRSSSGGWRR